MNKIAYLRQKLRIGMYNFFKKYWEYLYFLLASLITSTIAFCPETSAETIVIVGSSAAGQGAIEVLSKDKKSDKIIWISREKNDPYNKCRLSTYLENDNRGILEIKKPNNGIIYKFNTSLRSVNLQDKSLIVENEGINEVIRFDKLFLGVGVEGKIWEPSMGENITNIFNYNSLSDIQQIKEYIKRSNINSATIIGTGINALECASTLNKLGINVSIFGRQIDILSKLLKREESSILKQLITQNNKSVNFYYSANELEITTSKADQNTKAVAIKLSENDIIETDMIVYSIGSLPNTTMLRDSGIKLDNDGYIYTNKYLQTNIPFVYAAGDVALVYSLIKKLINQMLNGKTPLIKGSAQLKICWMKIAARTRG